MRRLQAQPKSKSVWKQSGSSSLQRHPRAGGRCPRSCCRIPRSCFLHGRSLRSSRKETSKPRIYGEQLSRALCFRWQWTSGSVRAKKARSHRPSFMRVVKSPISRAAWNKRNARRTRRQPSTWESARSGCSPRLRKRKNYSLEQGGRRLLSQASVLIVSDDTEFARTVAARWQSEAHAPEVTLVTSDLWHASSGAGYDLIIVGPVRDGKSASILSYLDANPSTAVVCVPENENELAGLRKRHSQPLLIPKRDGWAETLILLSGEALRRGNALNRAQRAERIALEAQRHAVLGRYM